MDLKNKIEQIKSAFTVSGTPLIKSDRFSQEEYDELIKQSGAHQSYCSHLYKNSKVFTDEEIGQQILTMLNTSSFNKDNLNDMFYKLLDNLPYKNENEEKLLFIDNMYKIIGWNNSENDNLLVPMDETFWKNFGSMPYVINDTDSNRKLVELKKRFGAAGAREIFGVKFDSSYDIRTVIFNFIYNFSNEWKKQQSLKIKKETLYSSIYNSLDEIEDNVVVKNIKSEAKKFYMDKSKDFDERCKVFSTHGENYTYIFQPIDRKLVKIFEAYNENNLDRHSTIDTLYIIEWWIDTLSCERSIIDFSKNKYHPSIESSDRNYTPSKEAVERLNRYYTEKLFLEGISEFTFDW